VALRRFSVRGLVMVLAAGLLVSGCNPDPGPTPSGSPTAAPSVSPSAIPSPTPTENAQEREQREAFEAAEKAYRSNFAEVGRLATKGGADMPSAIMKRTSTGSYLDLQMQSLKYLASEKAKASEGGVLAWVRKDAFSPERVTLTSCEDYSSVRLITRSGETVAPENSGERIAAQTLTVVEVSGDWKVSAVESQPVTKC